MSLKRSLRRVYRKLLPVQVPQPEWPRLLGSDLAAFAARLAALPADAPQILLAPTIGMPSITEMDSLLAAALTLRGVRVHVLLCDEVLPACQRTMSSDFAAVPGEFASHGPSRELCPSCQRDARAMFTALGVRVHRLSDYLSPADRTEADAFAARTPVASIGALELDGINIGEHARAGAIRYYARGALEREPDHEMVSRRYLAAALLAKRAMERLLERTPITCVSAHHGIYVPQGILCAVARKRDVRVVTWATAYRKGTFIFSHGDTYHHTMMSEPVSTWEDLDMSAPVRDELLAYLKSRWTGAQDWISFNRTPETDLEAVRKEIGIDLSKPTIGLLTNVVWDAQLHYPQNAFPDMLDWLAMTVDYFRQRPELQLLIRVHPAEVTGQIQSRQPVTLELRERFPALPANVFIIPPESKVSTYSVMMRCNAVIIYGTKTGVELTSYGIPVLVAGEAWIRNKGITSDAGSRAHYEELLGTLPLADRLPPATVDRARRYAYHFFFRRMIPVRSVTPTKDSGWTSYKVDIQGLASIERGADLGLDVICDGIAQGAPFVYPAERTVAPVAAAVQA